jgi:hypothetical protein
METTVGKKDKEEKKHKKDKDKKDKDKKQKHEEQEARPVPAKESDAEAKASGIEEPVATYSDGHPQDVVHYLEAKLILKPDRFTSVDSFRDFGKLVQRTAKNLKVGFIADPETGLRPEVREIIFFDTPDFRLYNNAFILRRRITYVDGFPAGDPEMVFKFRHPDLQKAAALDVRPKIAGKYQIKFKAEALPLKDELGGYRILYSHNCQFGLSQMHDADKTSMGTLAHVFPALAVLKKEDTEKVSLVNEGIVEEVLLPLGQLDFGKGIVTKCDVALWRTRGEHMPLVGEFAFQAKFERKEEVHQQVKELVEQFFVTLQQDVSDWISLGTTKTGMVYRLKGNAPQSHE